MTAWLFDTFVYTGLLIGFVLLVRRPVGRRFGAQFAYGLWALPFLRLLMPPIVLPASYAPAPETVQQVTTATETVWTETAASLSDAAIDPAAAVTSVVAPPPAPVSVEVVTPAWQWLDTIEIALAVWLVGALVFLAWRIVTYRRMCRTLLERARPVGEAGRVRLVETPEVTAPVAFGVFDKVVALPPCFMAKPDRAARDLAIEHELMHHRGHDLLANFAAQILLALHWFNPLAWYGWRAMRRDQEAACDARVLAGRGRDDRARYAALIAGIATGPRLALAAPMACPILGEASIIHRLRSLNMSDISPGRRRLGRVLLAGGALALPLTASISYAAAVKAPEPPVAPEAPLAATAPHAPSAVVAPVAPLAPTPPSAEEARLLTGLNLRHPLAPTAPVAPVANHGPVGAPPMPAMPPMSFDRNGEPTDPNFEKKMEEWGRQMEKWGEQFGEQYAEQHIAQAEAAQARAQANAARSQALAQAARDRSEAARDRTEALAQASQARAQAAQARAVAAQAARHAPQIVQSCDPSERARTSTADGRPRIVLCPSEIEAQARSGAMAGLRGARGAIAANRAIDDDVREEILQDLDSEIRRLEREQG